jgi:3,4-dihydroxy 2-butanone 4-phosphate synthase/GTP cyclohydrolase II
MRTQAIERVLAALEDIRQGKMVILTDDEDRENEGDLVMAAELCTAESINFMAKHARGLICLSLTEERCQRLDLPMMVDSNRSSRSTAFTVSIEARHGVSTGISAADRAHTVRTAVAPDARASDLVSPGHVFPLRARPGGVLQRTGHTEGSVDLARLAGLDPSGVICEIMNEDGTMARYPDLERFASTHGLRLISIADLIEYRLARERLVRVAREGDVLLPSGKSWRARVYEVLTDARQFLALVHGEVDREPTLVRVHSGSVLGDSVGLDEPTRVSMRDSVAAIEQAGKGVILVLPSLAPLDEELAFFLGVPTERRPQQSGEVLREYGLGAQVLADLGLGKIRILTQRPRRIPSLEGYGLEVVEQLNVRGGESS